MCDCYYHKCEFCPKKLYIHIGDYSTGRENISVVCPWCIRKSKNREAIRKLELETAEVIEEEIHNKRTVISGEDFIGRPYRDDNAVIFCRDAEARGVSLNQ